jgi:hypothetical protein
MEINDKVVDFPDKLETELEKISDGVIETTNNSTDSDNSGQ